MVSRSFEINNISSYDVRIHDKKNDGTYFIGVICEIIIKKKEINFVNNTSVFVGFVIQFLYFINTFLLVIAPSSRSLIHFFSFDRMNARKNNKGKNTRHKAFVYPMLASDLKYLLVTEAR